jgi:hypothetical protein
MSPLHHGKTRSMHPRLVVLSLAAASLWLGGCALDATDCSLERCEVWTCGEPRPACPCSDLCERPGCAEVEVHARDPETGECLALPSPCEVPDGWEYFADSQACNDGGTMCRGHDDCADGEVCDIASCVSDDVGLCVPRPDACPEDVAPVWGCDGVQYDNDCLRVQAGARLESQTTGAGCSDDAPVWARDPRTGVCGYYAGTCYVPDGWPVFFSREECEGPGCSPEPVWVFDPDEGRCVEIASECEVPLGWEFFASRDQCEGAGHRCGPGAACPDGMVCDPLECGSDSGTCVPWPADCVVIETYPPPDEVCGCDGVTYAGDCERLLAGVGLAHRGSC